MAQETIKEDTLQKQKSALPMIWLAAGVAVGLGAATWFLKTRQGKALPWDADKLIDACDAAAAKLDEILFTESRQVG